MATSKNYVSLIGNIGKDTEARQTEQGIPYAIISLATSTGGYKKQDGTEVPKLTQWHRVVAWNNLAKFAGLYVKKGMKIAVEGSISYHSYKNDKGQDVYVTEIVANDIILMSVQPQQQQVPQQSIPVQNTAQPQGGGYGAAYQQQPIQPPQQQPVQVVNNYHQAGVQQGAYPPPPMPDDELPF